MILFFPLQKYLLHEVLLYQRTLKVGFLVFCRNAKVWKCKSRIFLVQLGFNSFFAEMLLPALGGAASPANLVAAQLVFRAILPQTAADGCGGLLTVGVPVHMCVYTSICVCAHMYMYMYIHVY